MDGKTAASLPASKLLYDLSVTTVSSVSVLNTAPCSSVISTDQHVSHDPTSLISLSLQAQDPEPKPEDTLNGEDALPEDSFCNVKATKSDNG